MCTAPLALQGIDGKCDDLPEAFPFCRHHRNVHGTTMSALDSSQEQVSHGELTHLVRPDKLRTVEESDSCFSRWRVGVATHQCLSDGVVNARIGAEESMTKIVISGGYIIDPTGIILADHARRVDDIDANVCARQSGVIKARCFLFQAMRAYYEKG